MTEIDELTLSQREREGHLAMLAFATLVSGSFALGAQIANSIDPGALTAFRFLVGACILMAFVVSGPGVKRAWLKAPWRFGVLGGLMATYFFMMFEALKTVSSVATAAIFTLTPVFSAIFGWFLLRQITTPRIALALAIGAVGALWVIFRADLGAFFALDIGRGEAIFFVGMLAHALYTPMVRTLNRGEPTVVFTTGMLVAGAIIMGAIFWRQVLATDWLGFPPFVYVALAYLALVTTAATFFLVQYAAMRLPASKVMAYTYLTPSVVILWDTALGAAPPSMMILVGVALTVVALLLLLKGSGHAKRGA